MGMGEPLHNYDETMKALRMLHDEHGLAVSPRRVTLSTVGHRAGLERLAREPLMPNLAISLHATTDEQRGAARAAEPQVPAARTSSKPADASRSRGAAASPSSTCCSTASTTRPTTRGGWRGCSPASRSKVNLIPLNPAPGIPFERPSDDRVDRFAQMLADRGITVSVRKSRGRDIRAACGQLIVEGGAGSPPRSRWRCSCS